jgi:hypothetical protein
LSYAGLYEHPIVGKDGRITQVWYDALVGLNAQSNTSGDLSASDLRAGTGISLVTVSGVPPTVTINATGSSVTRAITFTVNGNGSTVGAGVVGDLYVPYAGTITAVTMQANVSGSCVIDIWAQAFASGVPTVTQSIVASDPPTLSSAQSSQDTTLTGWTTLIPFGGTWFRYHVNSATTVAWVVCTLTVI